MSDGLPPGLSTGGRTCALSRPGCVRQVPFIGRSVSYQPAVSNVWKGSVRNRPFGCCGSVPQHRGDSEVLKGGTLLSSGAENSGGLDSSRKGMYRGLRMTLPRKRAKQPQPGSLATGIQPRANESFASDLPVRGWV